jgi:hypothetical protein
VPQRLKTQYVGLKRLAARDLGSDTVSDSVVEMTVHAREMLDQVERFDLISRVPGKDYFGYRRYAESRPVNRVLFASREPEFRRLLAVFRNCFRGASPEDTTCAMYTVAYSVFAANDAYNIGRKASATFFEILMGHAVARISGISPRKKVRVPESGADLPTDYVFDPGPDSRKIHLPIKTSTRERAVQAWVHQLVLDRIFGNGVYRGVLMVSSETKRDTHTGEVIEICVPRQLQMFQSRVAEISRVYYLDPPAVYLALNQGFPRLEVRPFSEAFREIPDLLRR